MDKIIKLKEENIISQIYLLRGEKIMLDSDLANLYGVSTRVLNQAIKRNLFRFPADFMFQLTWEEYLSLKSQIVISNAESIDNRDVHDFKSQNATSKRGGRRKLPFVFTEHGAIMIASILNNPVAIEASIFVVRAFVKLRSLLTLHKELESKIKELEKNTKEQFKEHSEQLEIIFETLKQLIKKENEPREAVGFKIKKK
jgi:hypothetical protein